MATTGLTLLHRPSDPVRIRSKSTVDRSDEEREPSAADPSLRRGRQFAQRHQVDPSDGERLVRQLASWCRANRIEAMPSAAVPGPTEMERTLLAALGGVAGSLIESAGSRVTKMLPADVAAWMCRPARLPSDLLTALLQRIEAEDDPLARVYERLVSGPRRRKLGTFFTPSAISAYMTDLVQSRMSVPPATVVDPGAGVGAFTHTALNTWPASRVHAIDVNVVTLGLLAARAALLSESPRRLSLHHEDFLSWMNRSWRRVRGPRLIWGNPPYTRHQSLSAETKVLAHRAAGALAPGGRAGLSTYFLAASLANLQPGDSLCMLLPANWLEAEYATTLRRHLWNLHDRPVELHVFPPDLKIFPVAVVTAMVIWVGPQGQGRRPLAIHRPAGTLADSFSSVEVRSIPRQGEAPEAFVFNDARSNRAAKRIGSIPLASIAEVRRGVATGANNFFLLRDDQVKNLPRHTYVPAATRLRDLPVDHLDAKAHKAIGSAGLRRWMLWLEEEDINHPLISELIDRGKAEGVPDSHLCTSRKVWYVLERISVPDLLFGPMTKDRFRVITNAVHAVPTNTLYGVRLRGRAAAAEQIEALAAWMRSAAGQESLAGRARQHGSGTLKLEPRDLADLRIPATIARGLDRV